MKKALLYFFGVVALSTTLSACGGWEFDGKYENNNFPFDNNCSGTGGYYESGRCSDYAVYQ